MKIPILNRDFKHPADGWYHIEAKGEHPNKRAGVVQIIDDEACQSIVNRFNQAAAAPNFPGMLIDHEHFKHGKDQETTAYGWLTALQNRADGIYGQIRWTGTGQKAVDDGDYRFFSTEYDPKDLAVLNDTKPRQVRPLRLDGLTLTNVPNNKGGRPITNRDKNMNDTENDNAPDPGAGAKALKLSQCAHDCSDSADSPAQHEKAAVAHRKAEKAQRAAGHDDTADYHSDMADAHDGLAEKMREEDVKNRNLSDGSAAGGDSQQNTQNTDMQKTLKELGLPANATDEAAAAEVQKIKNRNTELQETQIAQDLETYGEVIPEGQEAFVKQMLVTNRAEALQFLDGLAGEEHPQRLAPGRVHNRHKGDPATIKNRRGQMPAATPPGAEAGLEGDGDDAERAQDIQAAINEYRVHNRGCSYSDARDAVRRQNPELFDLTKAEAYGA